LGWEAALTKFLELESTPPYPCFGSTPPLRGRAT